MELTSTTQDAPQRRNRRLLAYCVGFILLTNLLTIVFMFALRRNVPAPVILQRVKSAAREAAAPAAPAQIETRSVRVTSRPEGAVVTYQGQAQGTTPLSIALPVHAAAALAVEKDGYRARAVTVEPGQDKVHVRLNRARDRQAGRNAERPAPVPDQAGQAPVPDQGGQAPAPDQASPKSVPDQADAPATDKPAVRTPAAREPARSSTRRRPASDSPDAWTGGGSRSNASASPDPSAE